LIRYEDLVCRRRETIESLLNYLGVEASESAILRMLSVGSSRDTVEPHVTSPTTDASVGRWRQDLDESLQECCHEAFGDLLERFGYPEAGFDPRDREAWVGIDSS
jgi:hypothetical protein